jgi:hypothetical protein
LQSIKEIYSEDPYRALNMKNGGKLGTKDINVNVPVLLEEMKSQSVE